MKGLTKRILRFFNLTLPIRVNGAWFRAPVIAGQGLSNFAGLTEPWMTEVLGKLLATVPKHAHFFDVGVNLAQTMLKVKALDSSARYIGFEPNPFCVRYAETTIAVNQFSNCLVIPVGLGAQAEVREFFSRSEGDSAGTMIEGLRPVDWQGLHGGHYVPIFPLDEILERLPGVPGIIKIDVEGAELEAISGMLGALQRHRPLVTCEVLHSHTVEQVPAQRERNARLAALLNSVGYRIFQIVKADPVRLKLVPEFSHGVHDQKSFDVCDYVLIPGEKSAEITALF